MPKDHPTGHTSLDERAYQEIRNMIVQGILKPGEQIVQESIAEQIGISRTPLRRAIATLVQQQFLEMTSRGVAYVRSFTYKELASIWEIRGVLEGLVCRLAAQRVKPQHIAYLRSLITSAAEKTTPNNWDAYEKADHEFHNYLPSIIQDPMLTKILDSYQILSIALAQGLLRPPEETLPEHLEILDALEAHDADRAERAMVLHIRKSGLYLKMQSIQLAAVEALPAHFMEVVKQQVTELVGKIGATVFVACQDEREAALVHQVEGTEALRVVLPQEARLPLYATAAGKVLLMHKREEDIRQLLREDDFSSHTPKTKVGIAPLLQSLQAIREQGHALEDEEYQPGVHAVAVPILSCDSIVAALSVLVPSAHVQKISLHDLLEHVNICARTISDQL